MQHAPQFLALVDKAKAQIKETDIHTIKQRLDQGDDFLLIDVREDHEWAKGHLPGAKHLGKGIIERDIEAQVSNKDTEMVLSCGGGFRSALAAFNLQQMGYTNVLSMDGGVRGWREAGFDLD